MNGRRRRYDIGLSRKALIRNELGMHARAAAVIAKIAQQAKAAVWIIKEDEKVDASSIIDLLTLACVHGTTVTIMIDDPEDGRILNEIEALIEKGFGE